MRKKYFYCRIPMNLQIFAEGGAGDGAGADGGNGGGAGAADQGEAELPSFDDFLKGEGNQAEFDRRVQKAIDTAVTNAQEKWQALTDDKLSEAERLAKMTKEEKEQYQRQKKEKELSDREAAITRKELMGEAKNTLAVMDCRRSWRRYSITRMQIPVKNPWRKVKTVFQKAVETARGGETERREAAEKSTGN